MGGKKLIHMHYTCQSALCLDNIGFDKSRLFIADYCQQFVGGFEAHTRMHGYRQMLEDVIVSSLQGICWEYHETAAGDEIATQVFKNNVAKVRIVTDQLLFL